jgi:hypothetical protein
MGNVECLEPTRAFAASHLCDCGIAWSRMVLGVERLRAGKWAFRKGVEGGRALLGSWVCDVVVTPCDLRRMEMARPLIDGLLLLCLG